MIRLVLLLFSLGLVVGTDSIPTYGGACYLIKCDDLPQKCSQKSNLETTITLSNTCGTSQYCNVNSAFSGYCDDQSYYVVATALYPGQACDVTNFRQACSYGRKECVNEVCQSNGEDGACASSADCPTNHYCNAGVCAQSKAVGDSCTSKYECGRTAFCYFNEAINPMLGTCTSHFSVANGDTSQVVYPTLGTSIAVVDEEAALLCEGGFADEYTGICGEGPNSLNMGETCSTNSDCGSSDSNYEVSCKCGWNSQGTKHCDALKGDTPYKEARQAFKEYYDASTTCHLAARWESCDVAQKYHNWYASAYCRKCKELRAQYYVELLHTDQLSCMAQMEQHLPVFDQIHYHCTRAFACSLSSHIWLALLFSVLLLWDRRNL